MVKIGGQSQSGIPIAVETSVLIDARRWPLEVRTSAFLSHGCDNVPFALRSPDLQRGTHHAGKYDVIHQLFRINQPLYDAATAVLTSLFAS